MKFTTQVKDLQEAIRAIATVPEVKGAAPASVKITADEFGGIYLQRNTHLASMRVDCPAEVSAGGSALVGFESLEARLHKAGASLQAVFTSDKDNKIRIESGTWLARIAVWPSNEQLPEIKSRVPNLPTFLSSDFMKALSVCQTAAWKGSGRDNLTGVCVRTTAGQYSLLATDGRRVHWFKLGEAFDPVLEWVDGEGNPVPYDVGFLITPDIIAALRVMIHDHDGALKIAVDHTGAQMSVGDRFIRYAIPAEIMPNIKTMLVAEKPKYSFKVERERLKKVVLNAMPTAYGDLNAMKLEFIHNLLTVYSEDGKGNEFRDTVECEGTPPKEVHFKVNGAYIVDMLTACGAEIVEINYHSDYHRFVLIEPDRQIAVGLMQDPAIPERFTP